jgi:hypothetical protein
MRRNITAVGADQLRKLAINVEGISLAGGTDSRGTDSAIVLKVVGNRARAYWDEKENGEGKARGGCCVESSQVHS